MDSDQTQIRLLLQEQSDLGSHCLSIRIQIVFVTMRFKD